MARATGSRAASAKPVEKKEAAETKANGTAPRRGAKRGEPAPPVNDDIAEDAEESEPSEKEVEEAPAKKPAARAGRAKKADAPAPAPKAALKKTAKRKNEDVEPEDAPEPAVKKTKVAATKAAPKSATPAPEEEKPVPNPYVINPKGPRRPKGKKAEINEIRYTEPLKVFVFGEGSSGELGLGATRKAIDVKRPRFNEPLSNMNVVKIATGGMHVVALTKDNKIVTWGVNDNGALGRDTRNANVKMRDLDADDSDSDSEDETGGLIDLEATPIEIPSEFFPEDTVFVDVVAGDSCSFALTTEGAVYGWGTFRKNEGILGFQHGDQAAMCPVYIDTIKNVTQLACGTNHVYALDKNHHVYAWGNGQQNQLGRRVTERGLVQALHPTKIGFHDASAKKHSQRIAYLGSGDYHGLAIAEDGHIWAWGANNYCETGYTGNAGAEDASVLQPKIIHSLAGKDIQSLAAGAHHNIAIAKDGQVYAWGRCDGSQSGIPADQLDAETDEDKVLKNHGIAKILVQPTPIPNLKDIVQGSCGPDHTIVIDKNGKAYSWGFSVNYQTGQGTDDDIKVPTMIDNTAVRETKLTWSGCGGQYSILASKKE